METSSTENTRDIVCWAVTDGRILKQRVDEAEEGENGFYTLMLGSWRSGVRCDIDLAQEAPPHVAFSHAPIIVHTGSGHLIIANRMLVLSKTIQTVLAGIQADSQNDGRPRSALSSTRPTEWNSDEAVCDFLQGQLTAMANIVTLITRRGAVSVSQGNFQERLQVGVAKLKSRELTVEASKEKWATR